MVSVTARRLDMRIDILNVIGPTPKGMIPDDLRRRASSQTDR